MTYYDRRNKKIADKIKARNFVLLPAISYELLDCITKLPIESNKEVECFRMLDQHFGNSLLESFTKTTFLIYNEYLNFDCFTILSNYLRNRACNIANIHILSANTVGASEFSKQHAEMFGITPINIIEIPYYFDFYWEIEKGINDYVLPNSRDLKLYFSLYGGGYEVHPPQRTLLCVNFLQYAQHGHIEFMGGNAQVWNGYSQELPVGGCSTKQDLLNYVERLTGFCDQPTVLNFEKLYDQYVDPNTFKINLKHCLPDHPVKFNDPKWSIDQHCFASIVRETLLTDPWGCVTEKLMRCFIFGLFPIPVAGSTLIDTMTNFGFKFDTTLFDYSYLQEKDFFKRLQKLNVSMDKFISTYSLNDLNNYYIKNKSLFEHNASHFKYHYESVLDNYVETLLDNI